jgi:hypothetical protein
LYEPKNTGEGEEDKEEEEEKPEGENTSAQESTIIELAEQFKVRMDENETEGQDHPKYVEQAETHHGEGPVGQNRFPAMKKRQQRMTVRRK